MTAYIPSYSSFTWKWPEIATSLDDAVECLKSLLKPVAQKNVTALWLICGQVFCTHLWWRNNCFLHEGRHQKPRKPYLCQIWMTQTEAETLKNVTLNFFLSSSIQCLHVVLHIKAWHFILHLRSLGRKEFLLVALCLWYFAVCSGRVKQALEPVGQCLTSKTLMFFVDKLIILSGHLKNSVCGEGNW